MIERLDRVIAAHWASSAATTATHARDFDIAAAAFEGLLVPLRTLVERDLPALESVLDATGTPWTPGRALPSWPP